MTYGDGGFYLLPVPIPRENARFMPKLENRSDIGSCESSALTRQGGLFFVHGATFIRLALHDRSFSSRS